MKALKILGGILLLLFVIGFVLNMISPKDYQVERSITVNASAEKTFDYLKYFEKRKLWSPWEAIEPDMEQRIEGTDGTVGAVHHWEGEKVGIGSQEIVSIDPLKRIDNKLVFVKPWAGQSDAYFKMEPDGAGQKVTWGLTGRNGFPGNIFMKISGGMDKNVGESYELGLSKLKEIVEADKGSAFEIQEIELPTSYYLGIQGNVSVEKISEFYAENFPKLMPIVQKNKGEMTGMPSGLFYSWDMEGKKTEMVAAVPLKAMLKAEGYKSIEIPAGKALRVDYYGDYHGTVAAHEAIETYMQEKGLKPKMPCTEQYVTDPTTEKDPNKWLTKITYFLE